MATTERERRPCGGHLRWPRAGRRLRAATSDRRRVLRCPSERPSIRRRHVVPCGHHRQQMGKAADRSGHPHPDPSLAPDPQRRAVRMLVGPDPRNRCPGDSHGRGNRLAAAGHGVELHHHAVLPADSVRSRRQVRDAPELNEHEQARAERDPPRECPSSSHSRAWKPAVLAQGPVRPQRAANPGRRGQPGEVPASGGWLATVGRSGRSTTKLAPPPGARSTWMLPPCASTMSLQM